MRITTEDHIIHHATHTWSHALVYVALNIRGDTSPVGVKLLVILSGLLYILAAFHGGCIWAWRANAVPVMYPLCFPLLSIIALLLSFAHVALMSAFITVIFSYGNDITRTTQPSPVKLNLLTPFTLGSLVLWAVIFVIGLLPACILFRRRYRPRNNDQA